MGGRGESEEGIRGGMGGRDEREDGMRGRK